MLKINNFSVVSKESGVLLLDNISLEVGNNEIHCLLGKNGSGKTTLAYSLMGLERYRQTGGEIIFEGEDISKKKTYERARSGITIAFQEPARFEGLRVKDFLRISVGGGKSSEEELLSEQQMIRVLNLVGLDKNFLQRNLDEHLSGGERKRIELASVIMLRPRLMILDEPDASLDIIVYNELYDLMLKIRKEIGCSILLITHREEAGLIADQATLIEKGRVIITGRFRHVMHEYCSRMGARKRCMITKMRKQG
jgi:Fe-S cluster assembly ATP-binding protein